MGSGDNEKKKKTTAASVNTIQGGDAVVCGPNDDKKRKKKNKTSAEQPSCPADEGGTCHAEERVGSEEAGAPSSSAMPQVKEKNKHCKGHCDDDGGDEQAEKEHKKKKKKNKHASENKTEGTTVQEVLSDQPSKKKKKKKHDKGPCDDDVGDEQAEKEHKKKKKKKKKHDKGPCDDDVGDEQAEKEHSVKLKKKKKHDKGPCDDDVGDEQAEKEHKVEEKKKKKHDKGRQQQQQDMSTGKPVDDHTIAESLVVKEPAKNKKRNKVDDKCGNTSGEDCAELQQQPPTQPGQQQKADTHPRKKAPKKQNSFVTHSAALGLAGASQLSAFEFHDFVCARCVVVLLSGFSICQHPRHCLTYRMCTEPSKPSQVVFTASSWCKAGLPRRNGRLVYSRPCARCVPLSSGMAHSGF
jgi:hypothetical protein